VSEGYPGRQIVGTDLHRLRSVPIWALGAQPGGRGDRCGVRTPVSPPWMVAGKLAQPLAQMPVRIRLGWPTALGPAVLAGDLHIRRCDRPSRSCKMITARRGRDRLTS
jgi:hypothetical protein